MIIAVYCVHHLHLVWHHAFNVSMPSSYVNSACQLTCHSQVCCDTLDSCLCCSNCCSCCLSLVQSCTNCRWHSACSLINCMRGIIIIMIRIIIIRTNYWVVTALSLCSRPKSVPHHGHFIFQGGDGYKTLTLMSLSCRCHRCASDGTLDSVKWVNKVCRFPSCSIRFLAMAVYRSHLLRVAGLCLIIDSKGRWQ